MHLINHATSILPIQFGGAVAGHDYITCVVRITNDGFYKLGSFVVLNTLMLSFDDDDNKCFTKTAFRFGIFDLGPEICLIKQKKQ